MANRKSTLKLIVHHSVTDPNISQAALRSIFKSRFGVNSVGYNICVRPDGSTFSDIGDEGIGIHNATGKYVNANSCGICVLGTFTDNLPSQLQLDGLKRELNRLMAKYSLSRADIIGHRDTGKATACPGNKLYEWLNNYKNGGDELEKLTNTLRRVWFWLNDQKEPDIASIQKEAEQIMAGKLDPYDLMKTWYKNYVAPIKKDLTTANKKVSKLNTAVDQLSEQLAKCKEDKMAKSNEVKPGVTTSEFWMTLGAVVVGVLIQFNIFGDLGAVNDSLVFLAQVLATMGYTYSRGVAKS